MSRTANFRMGGGFVRERGGIGAHLQAGAWLSDDHRRAIQRSLPQWSVWSAGGGWRGQRSEREQFVGPLKPPPRSPHKPQEVGPPGAPQQLQVLKLRLRCVAVSSEPLGLQEEGLCLGQGDDGPNGKSRAICEKTRFFLFSSLKSLIQLFD